VSSPFHDAAGRFVWSVWGEIGVPSTEKRTVDLGIDIEASIHLTEVVAEGDPRLLSHVAAWRIAFPELTLKARMKRIGGDAPLRTRGKDRSREMSGSPLVVLSGASAVQLRMRSALGVSARAEIIDSSCWTHPVHDDHRPTSPSRVDTQSGTLKRHSCLWNAVVGLQDSREERRCGGC